MINSLLLAIRKVTYFLVLLLRVTLNGLWIIIRHSTLSGRSEDLSSLVVLGASNLMAVPLRRILRTKMIKSI